MQPLVRLLLVLGGLGLGTLVSEFLVRATMRPYASPSLLSTYVESERAKFCHYDSQLGWDGNPYADSSFQWVDCACRVTHNAYGYRDPGFSFSRTSHPRALFLGDSFTWGFGVNNSEIFTSLLQQQSHWEVINLGVPGYGTDQELLLWREKGWRWKPDLVFLVISVDTDFYDNLTFLRYDYLKPQFQLSADGHLRLTHVPVPFRAVHPSTSTKMDFRRHLFLRSLIRHSVLLRLMLDRMPGTLAIHRWLAHQWIIPQARSIQPYEVNIFLAPYDANHRRAWQLMSALIGDLAKDVQRQGGCLVLVVAPSRLQVYPPTRDQLPKLVNQSWDLEAPQREIQEIARRHDVGMIDLLPLLRDAARHDAHLYFPYNLHWTMEGHRWVATALERFLAAYNALPMRSKR